MSIFARGSYRAWQFWQVLRSGPLSDEAYLEVSELLTSEQLTLFEQQSDAGQQHGYRVMRTLVQAGYHEPDLLVAALLHDFGKTRVSYTWFDRVKVVLAKRFVPGLSRKWASGEARFWNRAFVVKAKHPDWGAESLAEAGGSDLSVALVRRHQETMVAPWEDSEENRLLAALQRADEAN